MHAAAAKLLQACPTLCDPIDGSPPGSPVPGILQARTLEWVAISFSNAWKWKVKVKSLSRVWLLATPWTVAYQAPPSMGFSRQEYWRGVPLPSPQNGKKHLQIIHLVRNWYLGYIKISYNQIQRASLVVQWFKTPHFNCKGHSLIPGWGTKIMQAVQNGQKKKKKKKKKPHKGLE